jgi:hypothetical protein
LRKRANLTYSSESSSPCRPPDPGRSRWYATSLRRKRPVHLVLVGGGDDPGTVERSRTNKAGAESKGIVMVRGDKMQACSVVEQMGRGRATSCRLETRMNSRSRLPEYGTSYSWLLLRICGVDLCISVTEDSAERRHWLIQLEVLCSMQLKRLYINVVYVVCMGEMSITFQVSGRTIRQKDKHGRGTPFSTACKDQAG